MNGDPNASPTPPVPPVPPAPTASTTGSRPPSDMAPPQVKRRRNWLPSLVWLIPIIAALVGITLVAKALTNRGPEVEVSFKTAEGLEAGKTAVKYKDVQIGVVQSLRLSKDRTHVRVVLQLSKDADGFTATDTRFWVVRPRLDTSGISGLGTLLSGAYIGADAGVAEETGSEFTGLETPPIVTRDASGKQYLLHSTNVGSLDVGSPVYFRRIQVGQIASFDLDPDGKGVSLRIFVNSPYDKYVGADTRFWHASGIDMQVSASGVTLRTQSLTSIVLGGIAFRAPDDANGPEAAENTAFNLADDETSALKPPDGPSHMLMLYFNQSLRGLAPGATVDFRGVNIGEVRSIGVEFDRVDQELRMPVLVQIYPNRVRSPKNQNEPNSKAEQAAQLRRLIAKGMRAQLRSGNLLTGQLYVAIDFFPKAPPVKIDITKEPFEMPTMPSSLDQLQSQVQEIVTKVNKVPIEEIGNDIRTSLAKLDKTLAGAEKLTSTLNNDVAPEVTAAVKDARKTIENANRTLAQDSPLQQDVRQTLLELNRTAASVRVLSDYLERHPESLLRGKPDDKK